MYNRFSKLTVLEGITVKLIAKFKKAAPRFELGIKDLQSSALPLGHAAAREQPLPSGDRISHTHGSLLFLCNGHGEDLPTCTPTPTRSRRRSGVHACLSNPAHFLVTYKLNKGLEI